MSIFAPMIKNVSPMIKNVVHVTVEQYRDGYDDGYVGREVNSPQANLDAYQEGYEDGVQDRRNDMLPQRGRIVR